MAVTNKFLENAGINAVRGGTANTPTHMFWAGSDNTFIGDEITVVNDFFRKGIFWIGEGIDSKFSVELNTTDAIGSYIEAYGIADVVTLDTGSPMVMLPSDIGLKSSSFSVEVEGKILFRRPS